MSKFARVPLLIAILFLAASSFTYLTLPKIASTLVIAGFDVISASGLIALAFLALAGLFLGLSLFGKASNDDDADSGQDKPAKEAKQPKALKEPKDSKSGGLFKRAAPAKGFDFDSYGPIPGVTSDAAPVDKQAAKAAASEAKRVSADEKKRAAAEAKFMRAAQKEAAKAAKSAARAAKRGDAAPESVQVDEYSTILPMTDPEPLVTSTFAGTADSDSFDSFTAAPADTITKPLSRSERQKAAKAAAAEAALLDAVAELDSRIENPVADKAAQQAAAAEAKALAQAEKAATKAAAQVVKAEAKAAKAAARAARRDERNAAKQMAAEARAYLKQEALFNKIAAKDARTEAKRLQAEARAEVKREQSEARALAAQEKAEAKAASKAAVEVARAEAEAALNSDVSYAEEIAVVEPSVEDIAPASEVLAAAYVDETFTVPFTTTAEDLDAAPITVPVEEMVATEDVAAPATSTVDNSLVLHLQSEVADLRRTVADVSRAVMLGRNDEQAVRLAARIARARRILLSRDVIDEELLAALDLANPLSPENTVE